MSQALVIVESPAKARTINRYLGKDYRVMASMGHVRDLPKNEMGVDESDGFKPTYRLLPSRKKTIAELVRAAKSADLIYLAADPDREGEAICWHLAESLQGKGRSFRRVMFHEITKGAIREAFQAPIAIDQNKVDAQQARRILDRLVGYKLSPLLWKKVRRGISAGRVQSVALRIICDREKEIRAFKPVEFWTITAALSGAVPPPFTAKLKKDKGKKITVGSKEESDAILARLDNASFKVAKVTKKERRRNPPPPFITSTLQQEAARRLKLPVRKTMQLAQKLYEGIDLPGEGPVGLITYMRTDSFRLSDSATDAARALIEQRFGKAYLPAKKRVFKSRKGAQGAHEAIRPTDAARTPESLASILDPSLLKIYRIIYNRFVASQMEAAVFDVTEVEIEAAELLFQATGTVERFRGYLALQQEDPNKEQALLPPLDKGDELKLIELKPEQHFTEPPPRFTEGSLVRELESDGIGRPSTYAAILATILKKEYVSKDKGKLIPSDLGMLVSDLLAKSFPDLMDVKYTARLEEDLDRIEGGHLGWQEALREFSDKFNKKLALAADEMVNVKTAAEPAGVDCEKCGKPMVIRWGRFGKFMACSGYPECKNSKDLAKTETSSDEGSEEIPVCESCGKPMAKKRGRFGLFWACTGYPDCKTTRRIKAGSPAKPPEKLDKNCPRCGKQLVKRAGRYGAFVACSGYPKCRYVEGTDTGVRCPGDGCDGYIVKRRGRRGTFYACDRYPKCKESFPGRPVERGCPTCGAKYLVVSGEGNRLSCPVKECKYETEAPADLASPKAQETTDTAQAKAARK